MHTTHSEAFAYAFMHDGANNNKPAKMCVGVSVCVCLGARVQKPHSHSGTYHSSRFACTCVRVWIVRVIAKRVLLRAGAAVSTSSLSLSSLHICIQNPARACERHATRADNVPAHVSVCVCSKCDNRTTRVCVHLHATSLVHLRLTHAGAQGERTQWTFYITNN